MTLCIKVVLHRSDCLTEVYCRKVEFQYISHYNRNKSKKEYFRKLVKRVYITVLQKYLRYFTGGIKVWQWGIVERTSAMLRSCQAVYLVLIKGCLQFISCLSVLQSHNNRITRRSWFIGKCHIPRDFQYISFDLRNIWSLC